jgi:hypothetical protein
MRASKKKLSPLRSTIGDGRYQQKITKVLENETLQVRFVAATRAESALRFADA